MSLAAEPAADAYRRAHGCLTSNRFEEAATAFEAATGAADPVAAAAAWLGRGEALFGGRQWAASIRAYDRLLKDYPASPLVPNALCGRGFAEVRADQLPQALATFQALLVRFPGHALAATAATSTNTLTRALAARERQRAAEALARDTAAINACVQAGKPARAAEAAERFLREHPDAPNLAEVRLAAAGCAFRAGDFPRARTVYRRFLDAHRGHPQAARAWFELGQSLHAGGLFAEAAAALEQAKAIGPAAALQAECLLKAGRPADALRLYEALARTAADKNERARATLAMGDCCVAQEKWAEAERFFLSVETLHASEALRPVALRRLADLYERTGQTRQAERARAELRRRYPGAD